MSSTSIKCLFCEHTQTRSTPFEDTVFNNKTFEYVQCTKCDLIFVNPLPDTDDLIKMYPVEYQGNLAIAASGAYNSLFSQIQSKGKYSSILDYGCGGGRFVVEALEKGYSVTGAEYNPELVANLSKTFTKASFLTIDDFYKSDAKYDIIFLSNVLEHLTNPKEIMLKLRERVSENGLFVLEGPVENNFNLTLFTRKIIFFIRKNFFGKKASHTPTHILYANRKNQEQFLKDIGLTTLYYEIKESNWPYPMRYEDCHSLMQKLMYGIATLSVAMSKIFPFWGNNFVYIGKVK
ncbi:MAG TPA: class I SAM-dependent methyltransferase [Chitinophagales bacterium]|jgi:2-polyprenyl-3-methyl-5-hydroxy-6-metoxy-1,4-benzoquinol methylase|nr:class I SAM-dependent methyltransferase [Chitinophagales bacterium]